MVPEQVFRTWTKQVDEARYRRERMQASTALRLLIAKQRLERAIRAMEAAAVVT